MADKTVKIRGFVYHEEVENPYQPGQKTLMQRVATRGTRIEFDDLRPYDQQRAEENDVFFTDEEAERYHATGSPTAATETAPETSTDEIVLDETSSVEDLTTWIRDDEPTVDELLEFVDGDPETAKKVLEAENRATDNDPRKSLQAGLQKIIGQA